MIYRMLLVLLLALAPAAFAAPIAKHVLIVSIDGGKPEVMHQSQMPAVMEAAKAGAATWGAQTIVPPVTLPSHVSMLAGVGPEVHQVLWNNWWEAKGRFTFPTVFSVAKQQGATTAMFAGKDKFLHFDAPGALDQFAIPSNKAKAIAAAAADYIVASKPVLCAVHFPDADSAGHKFGWGSPEQIQAFADCDAAFKILLDGIEKAGIKAETAIILSADHGGHDKTHGLNIPEDMTIPWITLGAGVKPGFTIPGLVTTYDTAATALYLLGLEIPKDWAGKPVTAAYQTPEK